ncbi:MAG: MoxR family ATPase [Kiritimatiellae bacterium]|nr:MoxR family ATPase [Kiritimatiellia bacterium]
MNASDMSRQVEAQAEVLGRIRQEVGKVLVGQERLVDDLLIALVGGGHILLEGVPGLAKTTAIQSLAGALGLQFRRISFTPDLLPSDVVGTLVFNQREGTFEPRKGPVFANLLLADEINRAPAKVQSALLEAMQERRVTIGDTTYDLPSPFLVMATQNPIEQKGTYALPEAQVDRFMLKSVVSYPSRDDERRVMNRFTSRARAEVRPVVTPEEVAALQGALNGVYCDEKVGEYILDIVGATRDPAAFRLGELAGAIEMGASPRATLWLHIGARASALIKGRPFATPQDVKEVARGVLRHRIMLSYEAEAENLTADAIVEKILSTIPGP